MSGVERTGQLSVLDVLAAIGDGDLSAEDVAAILDAVRRLPLQEADTAHGLGDGLVRALADPGVVPELRGRAAATALTEFVTQAHRMVAWWQAIEMRAMAALARPGVAVPLEQVLSAASSTLTPSSVGVEHATAHDENGLLCRDFEAVHYAGTSVFGRSEWDATVADQAARFAAAEVGARLGMSPVTVAARVAEAVMFVDELPTTLACWGTGILDRSHGLAIANSTAVLDDEGRRAVEDELLGADGGRTASRWTPSQLRSRADRLAIRCDPDAARRRRERARQERRLEVSPLEEGMARFAAVLDAPVATLAHEVLDTVARGLGRDGLAGRTLAQTRADVFADLMVALAVDGQVDVRGAGLGTGSECTPDFARSDGTRWGGTRSDGAVSDGTADHVDGGYPPDSVTGLPPRWSEIGSAVSVIVDAASVAEPGFLEGYGWIPPDLAQALAHSARRATIIVRQSADPPNATGTERGRPPMSTDHHPGSRWCGGELDHGTAVYRPPTAVDDHVRLRDRVCRFPGCRRSSRRCDLDHRIPFDQGGPTCPCNLDALCRFHHRLKTFTGWTAIRLPGERRAWRSPLGAHHLDEPEPMPGDRRDPGADPPPF